MSSNDEVRFNILKILYEDFHRNPNEFLGMTRQKVEESFKVPENLMDANIQYLKEKGLIKLRESPNSRWLLAKITAFGIDVIENKEKFREQFSFLNIMIQNIRGNVYGDAVQAKDSQVTIQQISDAFQKARSITEAKTDISPDLKKEVKETLLSLEEELKKKESDAGKIQKSWQWLKRNADWVVPSLTQIIIEAVKSLY